MALTGIVFDIQRASLHDGPGIRTSVFLKGCPLRCIWCHNPEAVEFERQLFCYYEKCTYCGLCVAACEQRVHSIENQVHSIDYQKCILCGKCVEACVNSALKIEGSEMSIDDIMLEVLADQEFYENSGGGITLTGGEPMAQFLFSYELLSHCRALGINTCIETSGYVSRDKFEKIIPLIDYVLFDFKISEEEEHKEYTGVSNELILSNLNYLYKQGALVILRCPIIPGINDTEQHFRSIQALKLKYPKLKGVEILPYHDMGNSKAISVGRDIALKNLKTTPIDTTNAWLNKLKALGVIKRRLGKISR